MRHALAAGTAMLLVACASAGLGVAPGQAALAPADEAELKTLALRGAREELLRNGLIRPGSLVVLLDTLVGPTPPEYLYDWSHRSEWLAAMRGNGLVDALFGPRTERRGLDDWGAVIEVGAPFPQGRDTLAVLYDWCVRSLPLRRGRSGGNVKGWRDDFIRADTGWVWVRHTPAVAPTGCTR